MKPDGVATEPSEPMEAGELEPVAEPNDNEGASQNGTQTLPHPDEPQNQQEPPSTVKEASVKAEDPKGKSKAPVKGKPSATMGPGTRPKTTQSRLANGVTKTAAATTSKKPITAATATAEKKPSAAARAPAPIKRPVGSSTAVTTSKVQTKVATVGTTKTTTTTNGTKTGTAAGSTATGASRRPATATASAATRPKTTAPAPKPTTAKPSTSTIAKTSTAPKTNRTTGSLASRPTSTSATGRTTSTTTTSTTATAASKTSRTASQQPVKPLATALPARKAAGKTGTTAPAKKPVATVTSRPAASKPLTSDAPKRPLSSVKAPQPKPDDKKSVPTRKVPPSPRNVPSRQTSGKTVAASGQRPTGTTAPGKLQPPKPTQSVLPLVNEKPASKEPAEESAQLSSALVAEESVQVSAASVAEDSVQVSAASVAEDSVQRLSTLVAEESVQLSAASVADDSVQLSAAAVASVAVATAVAIATEESGSGPDPTAASENSLEIPVSSGLNAQEIEDVQVFTNNDNKELLAQEADNVEVSIPTAPGDTQKCEDRDLEKDADKVTAAVALVAQEPAEQESMLASSFDYPAAATVLEVAEKADQINSECYEDVEEEKEGSQQVSLSEMSGTQPTEESRPGSAGLPGSIWRAGALLSEFDSEDVSCSQQGASELSAPGVLEGTESMDDLGDASLKGAEGASVGSPDFEKVPDILTNEDDEEEEEEEDDFRVYDMEVESERAEDSHKQHHDNEIDEDEDVEMASEGITESGLESYGNADEDDLTEDYRLDNLNRILPQAMDVSVPSAAQWNQANFADPWVQLPQPASTLLSSPSSEHCDANLETPIHVAAQPTVDVVNSESGPTSSYPSNLFEPSPCLTQQSPPITAEGGACPKLDVTPPQDYESQFGSISGPELASDSNGDTSNPEELKDINSCLSAGTHSKEEQHSESVSSVLPDIMQDLGIHLEQADEEEEPETLPADDVLGGPATAPESAPSSPSSATEDETSDTEGEMQISDPQAELPVTGPTCETAPVTHNLTTLEEREEIGGETEGGGGSDTPQSATSAASYGFDYMTSNSNAQSSTESCSKSPGIFSLENEEQLPDEAKDPSLLKELTLMPTSADAEKIEALKGQHGEFQSHPEHQYMLCGESSSLPATAHLESALTDSSSPRHPEEQQELDTQHPYYSTICENTDSPLAGRNSHIPPHMPDLLQIQMTMSSKLRQRPRAAHVTQPPRLPTDLPPRIPNAGTNTQLRCLEKHQQQLQEIQQRQEKQNQEQEKQEASKKQVRHEREKEEELEKQKRNSLELQLRQQEEELKQRQQIMQWQQELEQQQQQKQKVHTPVLLSPSSGLCTIYETLETSDSEEEEQGISKETVKAEDPSTLDEELHRHSEEKNVDLHLYCTTPSLNAVDQDLQNDHRETENSPPQRHTPLEFDWGKKVDIVHHLINQTLLLAGDSCSPLLLPGGTGGTLSPLESSLWPNLLPPYAPPSATVTSVSSYSPETPGSSAQGEWTVVELETHH